MRIILPFRQLLRSVNLLHPDTSQILSTSLFQLVSSKMDVSIVDTVSFKKWFFLKHLSIFFINNGRWKAHGGEEIIWIIVKLIAWVNCGADHLINDASVFSVVQVELVDHGVNECRFVLLIVEPGLDQAVFSNASFLFVFIRLERDIEIVVTEFVHKILLVSVKRNLAVEFRHSQRLGN
jgi:hypothetical protein